MKTERAARLECGTMRAFLAELDSGALPSTPTTRAVAAAFARSLASKRGRPAKARGVGNALRATVNGTDGKYTVGAALAVLEARLDEGSSWSAALRHTAKVTGKTADAVEKMVKRAWGGRGGFDEWRRVRAPLRAAIAPLRALAARVAEDARWRDPSES